MRCDEAGIEKVRRDPIESAVHLATSRALTESVPLRRSDPRSTSVEKSNRLIGGLITGRGIPSRHTLV